MYLSKWLKLKIVTINIDEDVEKPVNYTLQPGT